MKNITTKLLLFVLALGFCIPLLAQKNTKFQKPGNHIIIGEIDSLYSKILNEQRKIWIYVPNKFNSIYGLKKYPVVYLLDGDAHFYSVVGLIHQLSSVNGNTICPEMVVVGILNTDRTRDLTPTIPVTKDSVFFKTAGGAGKFSQCIEKELIPYIEAKYPVTSYPTLIGHSFGGLFAINTLINQPHLFSNYIALDPSLWWDNKIMVTDLKKNLNKLNLEKKALYLSLANPSPGEMSLEQAKADTTGTTILLRSNLEFIESIKNSSLKQFQFDWKYYPRDNHGSVPLVSSIDAMYFLFPWYRFNNWEKVLDSSLTTKQVIEILNDHTKDISEHFGYKCKPPESLVNVLGYSFNEPKSSEKAYTFFKMNIDNYPESPNVYDSMGDYYMMKNDTINAIKHFKKAVELGDLTYSKEKLKNLTKK